MFLCIDGWVAADSEEEASPSVSHACSSFINALDKVGKEFPDWA